MEDKNVELMEGQMDTAAMGKEEVGTENGEESLIIKLKKPYLFEKKKYTKIDLSRLEDMTAADMIAIENQYDRNHPGINVMPEVKVGYAMMMAARAANLPVEFFDNLPQKEAVKVKNRVMGFLFGSD